MTGIDNKENFFNTQETGAEKVSSSEKEVTKGFFQKIKEAITNINPKTIEGSFRYDEKKNNYVAKLATDENGKTYLDFGEDNA